MGKNKVTEYEVTFSVEDGSNWFKRLMGYVDDQIRYNRDSYMSSVDWDNPTFITYGERRAIRFPREKPRVYALGSNGIDFLYLTLGRTNLIIKTQDYAEDVIPYSDPTFQKFIKDAAEIIERHDES
jgi:hypothetical protein